MPTSMFTWVSDQKNPQQAPSHKKILIDCCDQKRACRFLMLHSGFSAKAIFAAFNTNDVTLLVSREEATTLIPQAICCVSFPHNGSYCAFLSNLIEATEGNADHFKATLSLPNQLVTTNLRQSFRVPVLPEAEFKAAISPNDDQWFAVIPIDIAQTGLEIELGEKTEFAPAIGDVVNAEFGLNAETVRRRCEVRRIAGPRVGLSFVESDDKADLEKATAISSMVISLQQVWLRSRVK